MSARTREERVASALAIAATVWFAFTAFWGINAQPHVGHIGSAGAAIAMTAENSLRWHSFYPLTDWYSAKNPFPQAAYCHHPFGCFWVSEIAVRLFDHADFVPNLPSAVMSALTPPLLYLTGKRAWGPLAGAATAVGFVTLPITVGFSIFHNLEVMTIFGAVLFFYGHGEYQATRRPRYLVLSLVGAAVAASGDWAGYMIMAPLLGWAFLRAFVLPRWMTPPFKPMPYHKWWALAVALAVGTAVLWIGMFHHADKLSDWLASAESRGGGAHEKLSDVLAARKNWIDFSFTPYAILVGKLALPLALVRFVWFRRDAEAYSLAMLFGATAQYLMFKEGADVHIFWPHYFGAYFAYAAGQTVATAGDVARWAGQRFAPGALPQLGLVAPLCALALACGPQTPDAVRSLKVWRQTSGKYDDKGALYRSQSELLFVVKEVLRPNIRPGESLGVDPGVVWGWEHQWALEGLSADASAPSNAHPYWLARASALGADRMRSLAAKYHLRIYGDAVIVKRGDPQAPVDAFAVDEHAPNPIQWMFTNNVEPVRTISPTPDPFSTWEWRYHLGQPAEPPTAAPRTLEQIRIAHNAALAAHDDARAAKLLEQLRGSLDRSVETHFSGGHELMGVRVRRGAPERIEIYFQAGGPTAMDTTFSVHSDIVAKAKLSLIPASPVDCALSYPPPLSTKAWKRGFVYRFVAPLHHRIGRERYWGAWPGGPRRLHGDPKIDLAYLD
jgi:hypothetical protein